jgi:hypothetical protein
MEPHTFPNGMEPRLGRNVSRRISALNEIIDAVSRETRLLIQLNAFEAA